MRRTGSRSRWILSTLCCLWALGAAAQEGSVNVHADPRLEVLIRSQIDYNTQAATHPKGFRVEAMITPSRSKAEQVKAQMLRQFPQYRTYLIYQDPYFRVRLGDFKTREAAAPLQDQVSQLFTGGVFTVPDQINSSPDSSNDIHEPN
ncbi:MAG TPA: SPOR domain-containing protein [Chitinophagaceae bacterium]|nr:SPOR domain-containing protein [Chitinophagaceae bacterium]